MLPSTSVHHLERGYQFSVISFQFKNIACQRLGLGARRSRGKQPFY